ncbi:hypothetical protein TEA_013359 [Camellia sinensis var. sinensis]|uniref:Vacuolar protein sorting-associated protein 55 homolog n=1 Tax=Camellia sinensis var. sinensis TaxID=542762 RepID=A0A4S4DIF1_CAMSN|nr:hypothetical protein TEA_013359 [Camellia sinensis var. sinensis]
MCFVLIVNLREKATENGGNSDDGGVGGESTHVSTMFATNCFLFWCSGILVLLNGASLLVPCSTCRACFYVFSQHLATDPVSYEAHVLVTRVGKLQLKQRACALYNNWWPMLSALMYVLVPMPCLFFGGGSTQFLISRDGGGWMDAAKFLTGASSVGSIAIPIILRHADLIGAGAMWIEFFSFFIFVCTVMCFHRASLEDEW